MNKSVWSDMVTLPQFDKLNGDKKTDVLIIGGGITGVLCAYLLKQSGVDCLLVEGNRIASGITKNTTAKITSQHGLIYSKLMRDFGIEKTQMYLNANENAIREYKKICEKFDCDFETKKAYTYSINDIKKIEDELKAVNSLGFSAYFENNTELPFDIEGAICFENQAQFNPLKFISSIAQKLNIYENTFIRDITPDTAIFENGKIRAKKIIVTTHFPFINKHGSYFLKLYQYRSYVSAFENTTELSGMYIDEADNGLSFRNYGNLLLIGGGGHRTGKQGTNWRELRKTATKYYPCSNLKYEWATQDCMSLDGVPYIGQYSKRTPNLYVATGFNKWGMTSSMVASGILCDLVQGKKNEFSEVFSPSRSILKPQLFLNGLETTANFLIPTTKRCPHMGCGLKWNKAEHTWDCSCHGSRFEKDGKIIDNPATGDANIKGI